MTDLGHQADHTSQASRGDVDAAMDLSRHLLRWGRASLEGALAMANRVFGTSLALLGKVEGERFTVVRATGECDPPPAGTAYRLSDLYCGLTVECGDLVALHHVGETVHADRRAYALTGRESYLGVPVHVSGKLWGALSFSAELPRGRWSEHDIAFAELLALWVSSHLEREAVDKDLTRILGTQSLLEKTRKIGSWRVDLASGTCEWTATTYAIHEEDPSKPILLQDGINYYVEAHRPVIQQCVEEGIAEGRPWDVELQIRTAKGNVRWVRAIGEPLFHQGELQALTGIFEDIDERKNLELTREAEMQRLEEALAAQEEAEQEARARAAELKAIAVRHHLSLQASHIGVWDWDIKADRVVWDEQMYRLHGVERFVSPTFDVWLGSIHPDDQSRATFSVQQALDNKRDYDVRLRVVWAGGQIRHIHCIGQVIRNEYGEAISMVGVCRDITDAVEKVEELQRANKDLEQFAYFASHDLQAPVRHVTSFVNLLEQRLGPRLDDQERTWMGYVTSGCSNMKRLIEDLLEYSRSGREGVPRATVDLEDAVKNAMTNLDGGETEDGPLELVVDALPNVCANDTQVERLFQNLIGNAIRYRKPGSAPCVHISGDESSSHWSIAVADKGIGIDPEFHHQIFEPFQRLSAKSAGSNGIGLAICKKIAEQHGGELSVDSAEGEGAVFRFTIAKAQRLEP
ncbi:MAG: ATP-binding protein [Myxococcota bacterium]